MNIRKGTIQGFSGSWNSGIGYLLIKDSCTGAIEPVPCENASTVRALECCFGNVIGDAHCVDDRGSHIDQEIYWSYDEMGLLGGFTSVEDASIEIEEMYENNPDN